MMLAARRTRSEADLQRGPLQGKAVQEISDRALERDRLKWKHRSRRPALDSLLVARSDGKPDSTFPDRALVHRLFPPDAL